MHSELEKRLVQSDKLIQRCAAGKALPLIICLATFAGNSHGTDATDITNKSMTVTNPSCAAYLGQMQSTVKDVNTNRSFTGTVEITEKDTHCQFATNAIPNHDFNDGKRAFRNEVSEQYMVVTVSKSPQLASSVTPLSLSYDNAVFLNGVKLDLLAAACYGVGRGQLGQEKIGCGDRHSDNPWRYDPLSALNDFGTDSHHAHAQPDGSYHYHGGPQVLYDSNCDINQTPSPVVGFAADGFPVYGPCFDDNGTIRKAQSGFVLKSGLRQPVEGYETPATPHVASNRYDGQFRGDYEYVASTGDLDECNGMQVNGQYGYYITDQYPWVMSCFKGTPDPTFAKRRR
ncbi:MAG: YHYH protein [Pseudomonadota bacterium]